jgi:hypothetical protein
MATTPNYALRYPVLTDAPNGPQAFQNLATDVDTQLLATNSAARLPVCIMTCGAATSIPSSVFTTIAFSTEQIDTANGHDNATNNSRYTAQSGWAGYYSCSANVVLGAQTPGGSTRAAVFAKNGTNLSYTEVYYDIMAFQSSLIIPPVIIQLAVGDYMEMLVYQNGTGAVNTVPTISCMNIVFLRPL